MQRGSVARGADEASWEGRNDGRRTGARREGRGPAAFAGILAATALVAAMAGAGFAEVLAQTGVVQEGASYSVSSTASANFPTAPSAALGTSLDGCSSGTSWAYPTTSASAYQLRIVVGTLGTTCSANDSAEVLDWTSPTTLTAETVHFAAYLEVGPNATAYTIAETLNVSAATIPAQYSATVQLIMDLGSPVPPAIDSLSVVVT